VGANRLDYTAEAVAAARSVLLELSHLLGEYRDDVAVIGGWVPELLIPEAPSRHVGSMDVDLALNHRALQEAGYRTIRQLLLNRGYQPGSQPFIFYRKVSVGEGEIAVEVDLLAGEYDGTAKGHRTQSVQDVRPRKARGCDLVFDLRVEEVLVEGTLPEGGKDSASIRVASIVPFLVMKGMALRDRMKEKDAWDVYYCVRYYPGGLPALIEDFRPHVDHGLVREGLTNIAEKFASETHVGPKWVADFEDVTDPDDRALLQRDAYERISYLLRALRMV